MANIGDEEDDYSVDGTLKQIIQVWFDDNFIDCLFCQQNDTAIKQGRMGYLVLINELGGNYIWIINSLKSVRSEGFSSILELLCYYL